MESSVPRIDIETFAGIVADFNKTFNAQPDFGFRLRLTNEELGEMCKAEGKGDRVEEEREWADLLFVVIGHGLAMGYDVEAAMAYVGQKNFKKIQNAANMKVGPSGKVLKPEDQEHV
jgi:NTP pyrophosphatase (non-canonical NTP hydrolase)